MVNKLLYGLIFLSELCYGQSVVGKYYEVPPLFSDPKNPFIKRLIINEDSSFTYMICNDVSPLLVCDGVWKQKGKTLYFSKSDKLEEKCKGLNILRVKTGFDASLKKGKAITIFLVDSDTSRFIGTFISSKNGKQALDVDKPIILDESDSEINIGFLSDHVNCHIENKPRVNTYFIYVCWGPTSGYPSIERLHFTSLFFDKGELFNWGEGVLFRIEK